jgi:N-methylhydantoinase B
VAEDVRQGYVSIEAAADDYGVVIDPETSTLDLPATQKLRATRRASSA